MAEREIDPRLTEAFGDHHERIPSIAFVDPLQVDDAAGAAIASANRLLRFEAWLDGLERRKRDAGQLEERAERAATLAFARAEEDARRLASSLIDSVLPFGRAGFFDELLPYACEAVERAGGQIDVRALFAAAEGPVTRILEERGMEPEMIKLAFRAPNEEGLRSFEGVTLRCREPGVMELGDEKRRSSTQARNPAPLPLLDGNTWVYRGAIRMLHPNPKAVIDGVPRSSPWASTLGLAKFLVDSYEDRSQEAERDGIRVFESGFAWIIIIIIVLIVLAVAGLVITLLCFAGVINNEGICILGLIAAFLPGIIGCFIAGGKPDLTSGTICSVALDGHGADG
jgi:hypothetical protein